MRGVNDEVLLARAYLNRVAEPCSVPLWGLVREIGPVAVAARIRRGDVPRDIAEITEARRAVADPEADLAAAERSDVRLVVPESTEWPHFAFSCLEHAGARRAAEYAAGKTQRLEQGEPVPPLALWVRGGGDLAGVGVRSVGIVGARAATPYGEHVAKTLAGGLALHGFTVVSGGAFGIDAAAHRAALAARAPTVLVSAGGLDRAYPTSHRTLYDRVAETGLLVSESPPGSAPYRSRFLSRNRIIAALSSGTVVVEAARRSGARNTATHCGRLGRPVMVVPGPVTSAQSAGCHDLLRDQEREAILVATVDHVLEVIGSVSDTLASVPATSMPADVTAGHGDEAPNGTDGLDGPAGKCGTTGRRPSRVLDTLDDTSRRVYDGLPARRPVTVGDLVVTSGLAVSAVLRSLPALELAGLVQVEPDGSLRRTPAAARAG